MSVSDPFVWIRLYEHGGEMVIERGVLGSMNEAYEVFRFLSIRTTRNP